MRKVITEYRKWFFIPKDENGLASYIFLTSYISLRQLDSFEGLTENLRSFL
jgi:hypothetical protein